MLTHASFAPIRAPQCYLINAYGYIESKPSNHRSLVDKLYNKLYNK